MKESIFDERAAGWDTPPRIALAKAVAAAVKRHVDLRPSMRVMDFGAGTGLLTFELCGMVGSVTAHDSSDKMIEAVRRKIETTGAANVLLDTREPGAVADSGTRFDLIVSSMALHHVADTGGLFSTFRRLLADGGRIALADLEAEEGDFHSDNTGVEHFGFSRDDLERLCAAAGFGDVSIHEAFRIPRITAGGDSKEFGVFLLTAIKMKTEGPET